MIAAIAAFVAFLFALIFHIAGGSVGQYWVDAELTGFIFLAIALAAPWPWGLRGPRA